MRGIRIRGRIRKQNKRNSDKALKLQRRKGRNIFSSECEKIENRPALKPQLTLTQTGTYRYIYICICYRALLITQFHIWLHAARFRSSLVSVSCPHSGQSSTPCLGQILKQLISSSLSSRERRGEREQVQSLSMPIPLKQ